MKFHIIFLISSMLYCNTSVLAQSRSDVKKFGIKTVTTSLTDEKGTFTEKTEKYYRSGLINEVIEFNRDGSIKKSVSFVYDKHGNILEETEMKGTEIKSKFVNEYKGPGRKKSMELEYSSENKIKTKKVFVYDRMGDKIEERLLDMNDKLIQKTIWKYDKQGLRSERLTYDGEGNLINTRKFEFSDK